MARYALSISYITQLAVSYAAHGLTEERMLDDLERDGFRRTGITARRAIRAYRDQKAAG